MKHSHVRQEYQRQHEHVAEHPHVNQLGVRGLGESAADLWTAVLVVVMIAAVLVLVVVVVVVTVTVLVVVAVQ